MSYLRHAVLFSVCVFLVMPVPDAGAGWDKAYRKSVETYQVPDVTLVNQDGVKIKLHQLLSCGKPVLVDFVYTTCTTICPVLSANFSYFQKTIMEESNKAQLISISIDPEFDSPAHLKTYGSRYKAQPGWDFLTGSRADIDRVLKAFKVYTQNKMEHLPVILMKAPSGNRWVRLYGLMSGADLLAEYEGVR